MQERQYAQGNASTMGYRSSSVIEEKALEALKQAHCANELKRTPEIPDRVDRLFGASEQLSECIAGLEQRLIRVLVHQPQADTCTKSATAPSCTDLGEMLGQIETRLRLVTDAVQSITNRLEL